jgi:hypothetical protein
LSDDASATYRGFRNQALYVLSRLLTDARSDERIYRPEGTEDLAVFDSEMRLVEAVQVKDHSNELAQSHFNPKSNEGFFGRLNRRRREHPDCTTKLASFGPLGPEFRGALNGEKKQRASFVDKLCRSNPKISSAEATAMLDDLKNNVLHPIVADLYASVVAALTETIVGGELERSVELLMFWVFDASEKQRDLTRQGLLLQLDRIGKYLAALRDISAEWNVSIAPITAVPLNNEEAARLVAEYRRGVQARWEHVVAGADWLRAELLHEVHKHFERRSVVIIRGASGQGKSTLGWRYIHEYCVDGLRFHVRLVKDREHALRVANALSSHVRKLNLKSVVYLDVSPSDSGWSELVRELVAAGLKVLIAVREEDFRRANIAVGDFDYSEVVLERVTKQEAEAIFDAIRGVSPNNTLDFEDTWARFAAEKGGPLLEFTHLVSQGESLASRIAGQIRRIQNDAGSNQNGLTEAHLELLALAAVANETGARVSLAKLCEAAGLNLLTAPLKALENEYLLRVEEEGGVASVIGLHPLRSRAIVNALFNDAPALWEHYAIQDLALIVDEDAESFLLAAFSRRPDSNDALFMNLRGLAPRSWAHAGSITRALIWEGVSRYELRNRVAILGLIAKYGGAWWLVCDSFVGMDADAHRQLLATTNVILKSDVQPVRLTPKAEIFDLFVAWVADAIPPPPPATPHDWASVGDIGHWIGHTKANGTLRAAIESVLPSPLPTDLRLEELALFVSGRAQLADEAFFAWHEAERANITRLYLLETDSLHVSDDGKEVKVHFSVALADSITQRTDDGLDWEEQTMKRVRLLRLLFPHRETFSSHGIGLELFLEQLPFDPTSQQIPAKSLPFERSTRLNAVFANLVAYRHNRPEVWTAYANAVLTFREAVSDCLRSLHRGWAKLLSESPPRPNTIRELPGAEIDRVKRLSTLPLFPKIAVDEWGFLSEEKQDKRPTSETMQQKSLRRFDAWRKSFQEFESCVARVIERILNVTVLYLAEHKGHIANEEDNKATHLLLANLGFAWALLPKMQNEFRARFGALYEREAIELLEKYERSNFRHLWAAAFAMRHERHRRVSGVCQVVEAEIERRKTQFIKILATEISSALNGTGTVQVKQTPWFLNDVPHLCIACDHESPEGFDTKLPNIVTAIWRATQSGGWRELEWKPLEIEWPRVALINLVRGKALLPSFASISTASLFLESETFKVQPFHYMATLVSAEAFANTGFGVWESPLLRSAIDLQAKVLAFVVTYSRFYRLAELIFDQGLEPADADRILQRFSAEMRIILTAAQRSYAGAVQILTSSCSPAKAQWMGELKRLCSLLLFELDEEASVTLTLESFVSWTEGVQSANEQFQRLITEIVGFCSQTQS